MRGKGRRHTDIQTYGHTREPEEAIAIEYLKTKKRMEARSALRPAETAAGCQGTDFDSRDPPAEPACHQSARRRGMRAEVHMVILTL